MLLEGQTVSCFYVTLFGVAGEFRLTRPPVNDTVTSGNARYNEVTVPKCTIPDWTEPYCLLETWLSGSFSGTEDKTAGKTPQNKQQRKVDAVKAWQTILRDKKFDNI